LKLRNFVARVRIQAAIQLRGSARPRWSIPLCRVTVWATSDPSAVVENAFGTLNALNLTVIRFGIIPGTPVTVADVIVVTGPSIFIFILLRAINGL
jgi:hypothetical protein